MRMYGVRQRRLMWVSVEIVLRLLRLLLLRLMVIVHVRLMLS